MHDHTIDALPYDFGRTRRYSWFCYNPFSQGARMSWSMSVSGTWAEVKTYLDAAQPQAGSTPAAVQHFMNHRTLAMEELKQIEDDIKNDPTGNTGVSLSASGHHDAKNRNSQLTMKRFELKERKVPKEVPAE